ncbi:MAG: valine--tRNA ligase [Planctomycetota bacterium]
MTTTAANTAPDASGEMPKTYTPSEHEDRIRALWDAAEAFRADPARVLSGERQPYAILIPPPNVTAALHLGHALNNSIQDILIRAHRMKGFETLWMPGTDHAGIATQTVVDRRLKGEGKPALAEHKQMQANGEPGRERFIEQVQAWKDEYEQRISDQLKAMGCSCDWSRQRFTMDQICARAVREAFFQLFRAGLIYRGKRLVNWDPVSQTALADDEVEMKDVEGIFAYMRYPLVHETEPGNHSPVTWSELAAKGYPGADAFPGDDQAFVTVATTRPETYMGDTAVAVNPKDSRAPSLRGLLVELPLVGRTIPIVEDDYVVQPDPESSDNKAKMATGFLKVTPAHDPNDWEIGRRHELPVINVMAPDASISDDHGWTDVGDAHVFVGKSREEASKLVLREFEARTVGNASLLEKVVPYAHAVGHSYRSHAAIEPYLSDQWYVKVTDDRLRGFAQRALRDDQRSSAEYRPVDGVSGDGAMKFFPDRYAKTYESWHDNLRDWCISRQLWWGHRIPVWTWWPHDTLGGTADDFSTETGPSERLRETGRLLTEAATAAGVGDQVAVRFNGDQIQSWLEICSDSSEGDAFIKNLDAVDNWANWDGPKPVGLEPTEVEAMAQFCDTTDGNKLEQDEDVLDTWFSSALWPLNTLGWPDSEQSDDTKGLLDAFNPTSVLCTAREIITLWVSRMVMFNRYFLGEDDLPGQLPFEDVFIHAMIQDGEGRKMSKSLGNGVDPLDIIHSHGADAMRFTLCQMTTQTQDVRMPVERDPETGRNTSPKFDLGRNFCNKLWNASRFTAGILTGEAAKHQGTELSEDESGLALIDRWMLSRLAATVESLDAALGSFQFSVYADRIYDLLWRDFCDWYLEGIKPTVNSNADQRAVLRNTLDAILRLLHPVMPFITESIYERLREIDAGVTEGLTLSEPERSGLLCTAGWPDTAGLRDEDAETLFERVRTLVGAIREVRAQHRVQPRRKVTLHATTALLPLVDQADGLVETLAGVGKITTDTAPETGGVAFTFEAGELKLSDLADAVDTGAERERLTRQQGELSKSAKALEGRLSNPGYTEKAPTHLVQQTRDQLDQVKAELAAVEEQLRTLG